MEKNKNTPMWCIVTDDAFKETLYLGWQHPVWDNDGYFWTYKEVIRKITKNNTPEHPFLFDTKEQAVDTLRDLELPQKCRVVEFDY